MTVRMLVLVTRKKGISPEEFRFRYENGHSRMAMKLFGHAWSEYRRHYLQVGKTFAAGADSPMLSGSALPYDAIAEVVVPSMAALEELAQITADPKIAAMIHEDEHTLFDREKCWMIVTDCVEEDMERARAAVAKLSLPIVLSLPEGVG